jgi:hypothetical protein
VNPDPTSTWLSWTAASITAAVIATILVGTLFRSLEGGIVLWALGMWWSALTPRILRLARRLERRR